MYARILFKAALWVGFLGIPAISVGQQPHPPHWAYSGAEDPNHWGRLVPAYSTCSLGKTQSPIDIANAKPTDLPELKLDYRSVPLNIIDNGHTIQINYSKGSTLKVGDRTYALTQFHFHTPSEEHVDGKAFPLVAHLVHSDAGGHLAVVAVLF